MTLSSSLPENIPVINAGLVLLNPFLPELFKRRGLMEGDQFKDAQSQSKAIQLLEYAVREETSFEEHLLPLNKILCGRVLSDSLENDIELNDADKQEVDSMLNAVIDHWRVLGNTSVQGLRETFLERLGILSFKENQWQLKVEGQSVDILLDQLPWSISLIKYPWMPHLITVGWR
jgi:Contractile injection system tape measure protein